MVLGTAIHDFTKNITSKFHCRCGWKTFILNAAGGLSGKDKTRKCLNFLDKIKALTMYSKETLED